MMAFAAMTALAFAAPDGLFKAVFLVRFVWLPFWIFLVCFLRPLSLAQRAERTDLVALLSAPVAPPPAAEASPAECKQNGNGPRGEQCIWRALLNRARFAIFVLDMLRCVRVGEDEDEEREVADEEAEPGT